MMHCTLDMASRSASAIAIRTGPAVAVKCPVSVGTGPLGRSTGGIWIPVGWGLLPVGSSLREAPGIALPGVLTSPRRGHPL